jgi:ATP-dependent Clp protease adaptor protein ClpS
VPDTVTIPRPRTVASRATETDRGWKVLLHNDDVTPFDVVIFALQKAAGLSLEVAEMVAQEAHHTGTAVVRRGLAQEDAERIAGRLVALTTIDGICPGVDAEAVADDA